MASALLSFVKPQYFTDLGVMASGYKLFAYLAGTTTKRDTYTDSALTTPNANPIVLDAFGRASIYLAPVTYKFVLATPTAADPPLAGSIIWTADNIPSSSTISTNMDVTGVSGEADTILAGRVAFVNVSGGLWERTDALSALSSTQAVILGIALADVPAGGQGTFRISGRYDGLSGLTAGSTYYLANGIDVPHEGTLTATPPGAGNNSVVFGRADSTTSIIFPPNWGWASTDYRGVVATAAQSWKGVKTFLSQAQTYLGAATTLPAPLGGVYVTDMTQHAIPAGQTNVTGTDTEIPAGMLNADGKAIYLRWGSSVAITGPDTSLARLNVGGNVVNAGNYGVADSSWFCAAMLTRITSSTMDVATYQSFSAGGILTVGVTRVTGLNYAASIDLRTLFVTGVTATITQTYFVAETLG